jgi:hypothetical protein
MGYVSRSTRSQLEVGNASQLNWINITNVVDTLDLNAIKIPTNLAGRILSSYLDIYMPYVLNYNAATNSLDDADGVGYIQAKSFTGGTWTNAILMNDQSMSTPGSTVVNRGRVIGTYDIATQVTLASETASPFNLLDVRWLNYKAHLDGFTVRQLQAVVRIWAA